MEKIVLADINKDYQMGKVTVNAVKDFSLEIKKGEFTVLAGPSGSGKTTVLNMIGAMDKPTSGKIKIDDEIITDFNNKKGANFRKNKIGFIFQSFNLIPVLTGFENIIFSLDLLGTISSSQRKEKVNKIMKEMEIFEYAEHKPDEMSGGQQQRVAVARALVKEPELILADEPTANLDSVTGENILKMMRKLNEDKGVTFVFSSHDKKIIDYAKKIIWLRDGKIEKIEEK
ncbi:MAG: ABC transporter ATP-binding protein [Candidatus Muiribacteriota bacterium]